MVAWKPRLRASAIHLALSIAVAACAALVVFGLWYPYPFREISGGRELFSLLVSVDVVIGPLITLAIYNLAKPRTELRRDLAIVALLQLAALAYGMWTVAVARPVHMVFEIDRLRAVHAVDVPQDLVARAPAGVEALPWSGPTPVAVREFRSQQENMDATLAALQGVQIGARPDLWEPWANARARILAAAKPVASLRERKPQHAAIIDEALRSAGRDAASTRYLPVAGRKDFFWTALIDPASAQVVGYLPLDPF